MNTRRENKELGDIPSSFILQQKANERRKNMKVLADFGDFQVVETVKSIDLIDISRRYQMVSIPEEKPKRKRRCEITDNGTAYMVVVCMFMFILCAVVHWICFGY